MPVIISVAVALSKWERSAALTISPLGQIKKALWAYLPDITGTGVFGTERAKGDAGGGAPDVIGTNCACATTGAQKTMATKAADNSLQRMEFLPLMSCPLSA